MEVRRNTRTSASAGRATFTQPSQGFDTSGIQQGISGIAEGIDTARRQHQQFEMQKRLLEESNKVQVEMEARARDPEMDPFTFSETVDSEYTDRANAVVDEYRELNYDGDLINDFMTGMGRVRNGATERATTVQTQALATRAVSDVGKIADEGSRQIVADVDSYESTLAFVTDTIKLNPFLGDAEKTQAVDATMERFRQAGGEVLAKTRPEDVFAQLDPNGEYRTSKAQAAAGTSGSVAAEGHQKEVADVLTNGGIPSHVVAGFLGNFDVEGGYGGALGDGGTASGIAQWRHERRENFKKQFGKDPHNATKAEQAQFVLWEMENPGAAGMTAKQRDEILNATDASHAAELIDKYYERSSGAHRGKRQEAASKYITTDIAATGERLPSASDVTSVDLPASQAAPGYNAREANAAAAEGEAPTPAAELHPVLAALTGEERLRVLGMADSEMRQKTANSKAEMDLRLQNIKAQIESNAGKVTLPFPTLEELTPLYGPEAAGQMMAEVETLQQRAIFMQDWETSSVESIDAEIEKLRPSQDDPALAVKLRIYEQAKQVREDLIAKRLEDPAAYAASTNPAIAAAIESGDSALYYQIQRETQAALGIPASQRNPWPAEYVEEQKAAYPRLSVTQRDAWLRRHIRGATDDEFGNFLAAFEGTDAYDDGLVASLLYNTRQKTQSQRLLPVYLQGASIIREDPARRPSSEKMLVEFQGKLLSGVRNTNPNLSRSLRKMADAIYVARGGDAQIPDTGLYTESLREAVGGKFNDKNTGWANYGKNGVRDLTILPPLVTANQFDNWLGGLTTQGLGSLALNGAPRYSTGELVKARDVVDEGVLVMLEPNVYTIKFRQSGGVTEGAYGKDGRPVRLRILPKTVVNAPTASRRVAIQAPQGRKE